LQYFYTNATFLTGVKLNLKLNFVRKIK